MYLSFKIFVIIVAVFGDKILPSRSNRLPGCPFQAEGQGPAIQLSAYTPCSQEDSLGTVSKQW